MIGVRFHDETSIEYPEATLIHTDQAPAIDFVNESTMEVIATLDAHDIKELYDEGGQTKPITA